MPTATKSTTETMVELLSHLVRFPTITSDHATNRAALDWVEEQLHGLPLQVKRLENQGIASLVATTSNTKNPKLWLTAHMDVVQAPLKSFTPRIKDGRLYGRGTHDMKFAIAVFITLLQELGASLSSYDLGLMITTDEEIGGFHGVKWLIDDLGYRGDAVLIPDCNADWKMEMGAKGIMWWEFTATGQAAHAGRAFDGVNAIDQLMQFVNHVRENITPEPCNDPHHQHTTLNLASVSAGGATNQVPDTATARVDIRYTPEQSVDTVTSWVEAAAAAVPHVHPKVLLADAPYRVMPNGAGKLFESIAKDVTGHGVTHMTAHGSSDARHFARHGIPTVNVSPTGSGFHVPDEWIDIDDLGRFFEVTTRFVDQWAKR